MGFIIGYFLEYTTFWRLRRKNKLESNSDRIFVIDLENDVILKCHLAGFMQILTYLKNDKSWSDETGMEMTRRVDNLSRFFTLSSSTPASAIMYDAYTSIIKKKKKLQ